MPRRTAEVLTDPLSFRDRRAAQRSGSAKRSVGTAAARAAHGNHEPALDGNHRRIGKLRAAHARGGARGSGPAPARVRRHARYLVGHGMGLCARRSPGDRVRRTRARRLEPPARPCRVHDGGAGGRRGRGPRRGAGRAGARPRLLDGWMDGDRPRARPSRAGPIVADRGRATVRPEPGPPAPRSRERARGRDPRVRERARRAAGGVSRPRPGQRRALARRDDRGGSPRSRRGRGSRARRAHAVLGRRAGSPSAARRAFASTASLMVRSW